MKTLIRSMIITLSLSAFAAWSALAGDLTIPYPDFVGGTPAVADQVDENFAAVKREVDDNAADIAANASGISNNASDITSLQQSTVQTATPIQIRFGRVILDLPTYGGDTTISYYIPELAAYDGDETIMSFNIVDEVSDLEPEEINVQMDFGGRSGLTDTHILVLSRLDGLTFPTESGDYIIVEWMALTSTTPGTPLSETTAPIVERENIEDLPHAQ